MPNTQAFESPLNRTVQTVELPGARWTFTLEYRSISHTDARILKAFFAQLRGMAGRFYLGDRSHKTPAGTAAGTPVVKGAAQTGATLITDGWTPSQANLLLPGDYIGVNGELKIITATCSSDVSGNATLVFEPPLRYSPADNAAITVSSPVCVMRLADDEQDQIVIDPERRPTVTFEGMEVFT
jgi:hypothetical protein